MAELQRLESDHCRAEANHQEVEQLGRLWLETGHLNQPNRTQLRDLLDALAATYSAHIWLEEERVFVLAARTLEANELDAVGYEMRQRRLDKAQ